VSRPYHPLVPEPMPLGRDHDFRVLLTSQGVSAVGDAVSFTALPLLVLALTGSGLWMGVVGALSTLPDLFFGMIAGALADRSDRKRMMFLADLGRAILTALIPVSVILGGPTLAVILIVTAPMSILRAFFLAGYTASVPILVGRSQLARANSIFEAVYSFGYIIGPAFAGFLAATIGPGLTLAIDAASFAASSLVLAFIRRDLRALPDRARTGLVADIREGIAFIIQHPVLRPMILFWGLMSITLAPLVAALTVHVTRDLGQDATILGLVLTAYGIGTVIGALLTARTTRRAVAPFLFGGTLTMGILLAVVARSDQIPVLLGAATIAGASQSVVLVTYLTARSNLSPDALLGRVGSTARTISLGLQPIGMLLGGALIDLTDGSTTIAVMGIVLIVLTLGFAPIAALRRATTAPSVPTAG
jgi:MFS transporter, ENTS family, enterobactin (siderophore) exporter